MNRSATALNVYSRTVTALEIYRCRKAYAQHREHRELAPSDANEFASMAVVQNRLNWERFRDEILAGIRVGDTAYLEHLRHDGYGFSFDVDSLPVPYDKPVLIVAGRQDTSVGYENAWRIIDNYPRPTFAVLDTAGHNLQIEQPQVFNALASEWLDRLQLEKRRQDVQSRSPSVK